MPQFSGPALRDARKAAGQRREHLAIAIDRSAYSIREYEFGRVVPTIPILCRMVDALGIEISDLFTDSADDRTRAGLERVGGTS